MKYFSLNFEDVGFQFMPRFGGEIPISNEEVIRIFREGDIRSCCRAEYIPTLRKVVENILGTEIKIPISLIQVGPYWRKGDQILLPHIVGISFRDGREIEDLVADQIRRGKIKNFIYREVIHPAGKVRHAA